VQFDALVFRKVSGVSHLLENVLAAGVRALIPNVRTFGAKTVEAGDSSWQLRTLQRGVAAVSDTRLLFGSTGVSCDYLSPMHTILAPYVHMFKWF
jgi:hypothetical protein